MNTQPWVNMGVIIAMTDSSGWNLLLKWQTKILDAHTHSETKRRYYGKKEGPFLLIVHFSSRRFPIIGSFPRNVITLCKSFGASKMVALAELGGVQPASGLVSRVEEGQFTPKTSNRA